MIDRDDDRHQESHAGPGQVKASRHARDQVPVHVLFPQQPDQDQVGLMVHDAEQHAAHEPLCHVPFEEPERPVHGDRRHQLDHQPEGGKGIPLPDAQDQGGQPRHSKKEANCPHENLTQENGFLLFSDPGMVVCHSCLRPAAKPLLLPQGPPGIMIPQSGANSIAPGRIRPMKKTAGFPAVRVVYAVRPGSTFHRRSAGSIRGGPSVP